MTFFWSAPVAFRRVALETPEWTSRDSNHHRQSISAGKTNAIPTEPSGRLLHVQDDGFTALREAGLKYECQQRLYSELGAVAGKLRQVQEGELEAESDDDGAVDAIGTGDRSKRCSVGNVMKRVSVELEATLVLTAR